MANTVPTLSGLGSPTFAESTINDAPQLIDASVSLTDPDDNFSGGTLTVSGLLPEDTVSIRNQGTGAGQIGFAGGVVTYEGAFIGFAGLVDGAFTVLLNANATTAAVNALLQNLTYANSSDTPTASRTLEIKITDAAGASAIAPLAFTERTGAANPFDGLDAGDNAKPSFADLDGDGDLDAIVAGLGDFSYYRNDGTPDAPEFVAAGTNPFGLTAVGFRHALTFGDLDGDGDLDALVGEFNGGELNYFENTGTASNPAFAAPVENPFGLADLPGDTTPSFVDLNGDGDLDIIIGDNNGFLYYFENTGTASAPAFAVPLVNPVGLTDVGSLSTPSSADLDGDGDFDLLVGENMGDLNFLENVGTASVPMFAAAVTNPFGLASVGSFSAPTFADVDGDGDLDVIVGKFDGTLRYFENTTPPPVFEITITITSENDAPTLTNPLADQASPEDQTWAFIVPSTAFSDPEGALVTYTATLPDGSPLPTWLIFDSTSRTFSGTPPQDFTGTLDIKVTSSDGALTTSDTFTLTITPVNDAPIVSGAVQLAAIDEDSGARLITQAELLANATDVDSPALTATGLQIATGNGSLVDNLDGTWSYTPATDDDTGVTFAYQVTDGIAVPVTNSALLDITPAAEAPPVIPVTNGTPGDDGFVAPAGDRQFNGFGGIDTIAFDFKLVDATISWSGNQVVVNGPSGVTIVTGFERFVFTDGIVDNNDGNWLVDDLFYYARNHDVWNAHVDADAHYDTFGWHEWRDPNAFFSTSFYLAVNADVRVAGINPLAHFHAAGWAEGKQPSTAFDIAAFIKANPDIAAAHVDPLEHFLQHGAGEGRQPVALTSLLTTNGFDYVYYLANNPDVAAAHVDPLRHFQEFGWKEGRDPNALFDTAGYLATYTDVATAGINPLDHFNQFGWKEGRDPSINFDTGLYLAAYADIAAASINPLVHFLEFGIREGRSAFADGVWG